MSEVLLLQFGQVQDAAITTSVIKRLVLDGHKVHCLADGQACELLKYCNATVNHIDQASVKPFYDIVINLSPSLVCADIIDKIDAETKLGYGKVGESLSFYNKGAELHYKHRYIGISTEANLFQLTYSLAGLVWRGEGYNFGYYPRNRTNRGSTGIAVKDQLLREFVKSNINTKASKILIVPFKQNVLKQIDEINRGKIIVTDDLGIMHIALALRKNVEYIVRRTPPYKIEMFNSGRMHIFDSDQLKEIS